MNTKILVTIVTFVFFIATAVADTIDFSIDPNIDIGTGFDTLQSKVRGDCVEITEPQQTANVMGQEVRFSLLQIEDSFSLNEHLHISASASLKADIFGASGKVSLSRNVKVNDYSIYAVVSIFVRNNTYRMRDIKLKQETYELYEKDKERFRNRCGDTFVSGYITGGEFHSIIEIKTSSQAEKHSLSSELTGSYGIFSGNATFKQSLEKIAKNKQIHVHVMHTGGTGEIISTKPEAMIAQAKNFPDTVVSDKARPILATIQSYETLKLPIGITPVDKSTQQEVILELARLNNYAQKQLANIDYILFHPNEFKNPNIQSLNQAASITRTLLNTVRRTARACYNKINACVLPTSLKLPSVNLPERYASVTESCKKLIYKEKVDPICGVKLYKFGEGKLCGVKNYKNGTGAVCGVELYRLAKNKACGVIHPCGVESPPIIGAIAGASVGLRSTETEVTHQECRHPENGVEKYKSCRHASFGVEKYHTCRAPAFGVERYNKCRHPNFSVEDI